MISVCERCGTLTDAPVKTSFGLFCRRSVEEVLNFIYQEQTP